MKIQRCKGMKDLSPAEMAVFREVEATCLDTFRNWGYREVRTPTIEHLHLFTSAGTLTPGRLGKVYSFLDWDGWSGERVVLRPDGTIPVARLYVDSLAGETARLSYAENMLMFEEEAERQRERWQCGVELIGEGKAAADAELVALSLDTVKKLGIKNAELRLSHAGLIVALLKKLGLAPEEQHKVFDRVLDGDAEALAEVGKTSPELESALKPLVRLKGQTAGFLRNMRAALPAGLNDLTPYLDDFLATVAVLDDLGIDYKINIAAGAGFEYYTGLIFQLYAGNEKIGGGGRYDALINAMGGGDVPAAGFALYLDRLVKLTDIRAAGDTTLTVVAGKGALLKIVYQAAAELRKAGYSVVTGGKKGADTVTVTADGYRYGRTAYASMKELLKELLKGLEG